MAHKKSTQEESSSQAPEVELARLTLTHELTPEESKKILSTAGDSVVYGPGIGDLTLKTASVILFPPYGLYLLGQAVWGLSTGDRAPEITDLLPDEDKKTWDSTYTEIVSGPGRVNAAFAGKEFKTSARMDAEWAAINEEIKRNRGLCEETTGACDSTRNRTSSTTW